MRILAIDTSLDRLGLCLLDGEKARAVSLGGMAKQDLLLERALKRLAPDGLGTLDAIAVCTGPGRFTGIRVGVAFAVMLGRTLEVPVAGLRALETLAWQSIRNAKRKGPASPFAVCAARPIVRDELFWGAYRVSADGAVEAVEADRWGKPAELQAALPKDIRVFAGEGAQAASLAAGRPGSVVLEGPLEAEALARRAAWLLRRGAPLPPAEPFYLKPGNYERPVALKAAP